MSVAPNDWCDNIDQRDWNDRAEPVLIDDPIENIDANEPMLPIEAHEPTLPIDMTGRSRQCRGNTEQSRGIRATNVSSHRSVVPPCVHRRARLANLLPLPTSVVAVQGMFDS